MTTKHRRQKDQEESDIMRLWKLAIVGGSVIVTVAGSVWGASVYVQSFATRDDLIVVQAQVQTALDTQMEDLMARIAQIEAKPRKTQEDRDQIKYLRDQLDRLRRLRAIK